MVSRSLPRYFVSRSDSQFPDSGSASQLEPCHAIDSFFLGGRHVVEKEWVVTIDTTGALKAIEGDAVSALPEVVQQDVAFNEVIGAAASRSIDGQEFYVFYLEALEQPPETPGLNDPVYLYGTLYGPFPARSQDSYIGIEGQLTVNRIDFLAGIVQSGSYAFHYPTDAASTSSTQRCFHILLPGDREEEIARGKGLILAYPLMPPEIVMGEPWNELLVAGLVYDVLAALKEDIEKENVRHPLAEATLPVASRRWFIQQLEAQGYAIKGDLAVRQPGATTTGFPRLLVSALGNLIGEKVPLPPEATIDEFIEIARQALHALPGYPPSRTKVLQSRIGKASSEARAEASRKVAPPPPVKTPSNDFAQRPATAPAPAPQNNRRTDWMKDFMAQRSAPSSTPTRLTSIADLALGSPEPVPPRAKKPRPDWMSDFESAEELDKKTKQTERVKETGKVSEKKPDWMSDFE